MRIEDIDVSLSKGNLSKNPILLLLYLGVAVGCCVPVLTLIMLCIPQIEWDNRLVGIMAGLNVFFIAVIFLLAFLIIKNNRIVKEVKTWLEDAVEIKAHSKKIGEIRSGMFYVLSIQIEIRFQYGGKVHKKQSSVKVSGLPKGYAEWFNRYADKDVDILYSPKYDEVMILKDKESLDA